MPSSPRSSRRDSATRPIVLEDGVTFVHVAFMQDGHEAPLPQLPAFQRFQRDLAERCDEAPQVTRLEAFIGSYGV